MGIFRRRRHDDMADDAADDAADDVADDDLENLEASDVAAPAQADDEDEDERLNRVRGPFDASEVDDDGERIDLGALRIAPVDGMQLRLELDSDQESVVSAHVLVGDSGLQLQAYAAPRTLGIWPDIRTEIADTVTAQGGTAEVVDGPLGRELAARIPARGSDGRTVHNAVRFLGIDGPRWFLRAVLSGPAASDEAQARPLVDIIRSVVVVRDEEARPPREALPLRVPAAIADDETPPASDDAATPTPGTHNAENLRPFERGPEITEVR